VGKTPIIYWAEPSLGEEEKELLEQVIDSTWIGGNGPLVKQFEKEFARKVGARYALAVNNGTSALLCAILALKEKWILPTFSVPTFTFIATVNSVKVLDLEFDLIDCKRDTWNIDPKKVRTKTDVLITVDVGGLPCDYKELRKRKQFILEDAAEAFGATYRGKKIGSIADVTTFSLHSAKIISSGEGGFCTTNDKELYEIMRSITNQGYTREKKPWEYEHVRVGLNFRMTEMQAAIGLVQLRKSDKFLRLRQEIAKIYKEELYKYGEFQKVPRDRTHPYFLFGILVEPKIRDKLCKEMLKQGVQTKITWKPVHLQKPYLRKRKRKKFKVSEEIYRRIISLPIHNSLSEEDAKEVVDVFKRSWKKARKL